jgi:hypothetical protein
VSLGSTILGPWLLAFGNYTTLSVRSFTYPSYLGLVYDKKNDEQRRKAHKLITLLIDDCAKEGYGEYRTHLGTLFGIKANRRFDGPDHGHLQLERRSLVEVQ